MIPSKNKQNKRRMLTISLLIEQVLLVIRPKYDETVSLLLPPWFHRPCCSKEEAVGIHSQLFAHNIKDKSLVWYDWKSAPKGYCVQPSGHFGQSRLGTILYVGYESINNQQERNESCQKPLLCKLSTLQNFGMPLWIKSCLFQKLGLM